MQEQNRLQVSGQTSVGNPISSGNDITFGTGDGGLGYTVENNDTRSVGERLGDRAKVFEDYAQKIREANIELVKLKATEGDHTAEIAEKEAQINK